jgi:hypothetical protein
MIAFNGLTVLIIIQSFFAKYGQSITAAAAHEQMAATMAIANLAKASPDFGSQQIIPSPLDPRLLWSIAPAVAEAAMNSGMLCEKQVICFGLQLREVAVAGVARINLDIDDYRAKLQEESEMLTRAGMARATSLDR